MNPLEQIMSVEQAAEQWKLHPSYVKNLCAQGRVKAIKLGKTWIIDRRQPNPSVRDALEYAPRDNEPLTEEEQQPICQADADFESRETISMSVVVGSECDFWLNEEDDVYDELTDSTPKPLSTGYFTRDELDLIPMLPVKNGKAHCGTIEIQLDGCITTVVDVEHWTDAFLEWLESRGECFGGGINRYVPDYDEILSEKENDVINHQKGIERLKNAIKHHEPAKNLDEQAPDD